VAPEFPLVALGSRAAERGSRERMEEAGPGERGRRAGGCYHHL